MGFTVTEDGQLKVTSPPNTLTARDEEILNALLNEAKGLQSLTLKHAKTVIELVKRDKPQFEGKVKLDLSNFHKMIDYGLLLNKGALDLRSTDSWLDQLHKNAEKYPFEKGRGCTSKPDRLKNPGNASVHNCFAGCVADLVMQHLLIADLSE